MNASVGKAEGATSGAGVYVPVVLALYDLWVLGLSNRYAWRCPTSEIVALYNRHASANHLDVGVGTGYLLDHCVFPTSAPKLTLLDLNPNSLAQAARRVRRYHPRTVRGDVLLPLELGTERFDSISVNYLLHCLPGPMDRKHPALAHLAAHLAPGGVLFGATILGESTPKGPFGHVLMRIYNATGVFGNKTDDLAALEHTLQQSFGKVEVSIHGSVAFFVAHGPLEG